MEQRVFSAEVSEFLNETLMIKAGWLSSMELQLNIKDDQVTQIITVRGTHFKFSFRCFGMLMTVAN